MFLDHILRPNQKPISSLPDHFGIGVKMTSKNIIFTLGFWVELPPILGLGFSACLPACLPGAVLELPWGAAGQDGAGRGDACLVITAGSQRQGQQRAGPGRAAAHAAVVVVVLPARLARLPGAGRVASRRGGVCRCVVNVHVEQPNSYSEFKHNRLNTIMD